MTAQGQPKLLLLFKNDFGAVADARSDVLRHTDPVSISTQS